MAVPKRKNIDGVAPHVFDEADNSYSPASTTTPMPVSVVSGGGGGTQYTEGDTDASITGTAAMMEGAASTLLPIQGTVADGLLVNLGANNDVTVSNTVDVNLASTSVVLGVEVNNTVYTEQNTRIIHAQDSVTAGTTSAVFFAADASLTGLYLKNTSTTGTVSFKWGGTAVINKGLTLLPGDSVDIPISQVDVTAALHIVASEASVNVAYIIFH